jgi:tetratricopeptide (TPR) repeat protein
MATGLIFFLSPSTTDHRIRRAPQRRDGVVDPAGCVLCRPGWHDASARLSSLILGLICIGRALGATAHLPGEQPGTEVSPAPAIQAAPFVFPADDRELLAFDEDMGRFFAARVDDRASTFTRLNQIVTAILGEQGLHFAYEKDGDYSARETYRRRRGNCLSFSLLAVAAARAHGLTAWFCEVNTYPRWDRSGSLITEVWHLNVHASAGAAQYEINPLGGAERQDQVAARKAVSDARAFANFYNNLAVRRLADGAAAEAQAMFDRALAADSTAAFVWANKGSALRLAGDYAGANDCLERALKEDPAELAALSTLADLYTQTGRLKEAAQLGKKVERYRLKNPYYLSFLAQAEYSRGQYREAEGHLRRAMAIKDDEPEFYELRILVAQGLGQSADAQRWVAKLQALRARPDPEHPAIHDTGNPP